MLFLVVSALVQTHCSSNIHSLHKIFLTQIISAEKPFTVEGGYWENDQLLYKKNVKNYFIDMFYVNTGGKDMEPKRK